MLKIEMFEFLLRNLLIIKSKVSGQILIILSEFFCELGIRNRNNIEWL